MTGDVELGDDLALVIVRAGATDAAIEATQVIEVCPEAEWNGQPPIELSSADDDAAADIRVIVVRRRSAEPVALRARGGVRVKHVRRAAALAMPALLRLYVPWIASVVVEADEGPIVVVDPNEVDAWARSLK